MIVSKYNGIFHFGVVGEVMTELNEHYLTVLRRSYTHLIRVKVVLYFKRYGIYLIIYIIL